VARRQVCFPFGFATQKMALRLVAITRIRLEMPMSRLGVKMGVRRGMLRRAFRRDIARVQRGCLGKKAWRLRWVRQGRMLRLTGGGRGGTLIMGRLMQWSAWGSMDVGLLGQRGGLRGCCSIEGGMACVVCNE
jgi:hypothetical protein